jgi:hypothetical protein
MYDIDATLVGVWTLSQMYALHYTPYSYVCHASTVKLENITIKHAVVLNLILLGGVCAQRECAIEQPK